MHSVILSVGAYALLLSSFITIAIFLRQFKQTKTTSLYILSTSDVLFSILTSIVLLINGVGNATYADRSEWNDIFPDNLDGGTWNQESDNGKEENDKFRRFYERSISFDATAKENNSTAIPECNMANVMMKYGMLLFPFTNSFVSLLMFSVQCNLNVRGLKRRCFKFLQFQKCAKEAAHKNDDSVNKSEPENVGKCEISVADESSKIQSYPKSKLVKRRNLLLIKEYKRKLLEAFKSDGIEKDGKKIIGIFVISQWVIPILVTGLLYLAEYDNRSYIKCGENAQCFSGNIFNDRYNTILMNIVQDVYSGNDTQVNEIISKVQSVVHSVLNDTYEASRNISHTTPYNISDLLNATKYMEYGMHTSTMNNSIANTEANPIENTAATEYGNPDNLTSIENSNDSLNYIELKNKTNEYDTELLLFNSLMTNSSETTSANEDNSQNAIIANNTEPAQFNEFETVPSTEAEIIAGEPTELNAQQAVPVISNDQIYAGIIERIRNITMHYKLKGSYKNNYQPSKKQSKQRNLEPQFPYTPTMDKENPPSVIKIINYQNDNTSMITPVHIIDTCFLSIPILKLHLLVLVFVIYFLPILFSSILQQQGKLNCKIVLNRLQAECAMLSNEVDTNVANNASDASPIYSTNFKSVFMGEHNPTHSIGNLEESGKEFRTLEQVEIRNEGSNERYKIIDRDRSKMHSHMTKQVENTLKLFKTIKMSLLCGVLLWTPIFSEVLFKVFTSLYVPEWLLNITYLAGVAFGILRNILNLKMIQFQETDASAIKTNSIHPIEVRHN